MRASGPAASLALALGLAGCVVGPDYRAPQVALPGQYRAGPASAAAASPPPQADAPAGPWWRSFRDAQLDALEAEALAQNLTLAQARARLDQARARLAGVGARRAPIGSASAQASHERRSLANSTGRIIEVFPQVERSSDTYDAAFGASWEVDLFGGLGRTAEAARADLQEAGAEGAAARLAISAAVAEAYVDLRRLQQRVRLLDRRMVLLRDREALVQLRVDQGWASARDLDAAAAERAQASAERPALAAGVEAALDRLAVLRGRLPEADRGDLLQPREAPRPELRTPGLPADLLRRRPDLVAAERRVAAANARIGAAVAEYYPKIGVQALLGAESLEPADLLTPRAALSQTSLGLRWRLFDFGRISAEIAVARGREAEALAAYRETVLRAAADVEQALRQRQAAADQVRERGEAARRVGQRRDAAAAALAAGAGSRLDLSRAELQLLDAETRRLEALAAQAFAEIQLARATGGAV